MDNQVTAAIIGLIGAITAAIIGAFLGRADFVDRIFRKNKYLNLPGKWESTWTDLDDATGKTFVEKLTIVKQKNSRIYGYIVMQDELDKRWDFEGNFSGRFLQLFYFPSEEAEDKLFLDYGCYFFDMLGNGDFEGYSVGFVWNANAVTVSRHRLRRIK